MVSPLPSVADRSATAAARPARRPDIDMAKGLAILLVVFGHLVARADPAGVTWYEPLRRAVYAFHMPFFLYLSGLVAVLSGGLFTPLAAWPGLARSRARRLLLPFFGLGLLIVLGKLAAAHFLFVDNAPHSLGAGLGTLFWHTAASPALSIWYLFVLFVLSLAASLLMQGQAQRLPMLLAVSLLLYCLPLPAYLYLDHVGRYAVFFCLGACAATMNARWHRWMDAHWRTLLAALILSLATIAAYGGGWPDWAVLLPSRRAVPPRLARRWCAAATERRRQDCCRLGRYSFAIYLFNTPCIGLAKGVLLQVWPTSGSRRMFRCFAPASDGGRRRLDRCALKRAFACGGGRPDLAAVGPEARYFLAW